MVDNLGDLKQEIRDLMRRIRVLESASPLGWSSVTEGALEIRSPEGLIVIGSAKVSGTLTGSGTFDWTGPMNLQGAQTITGPTTFTGQMTVNGPWKFVGNGQITGDVDVTGNIKILPGGKIQVGDMIIDPTGGGSVTFPGGAVVQADPGGGIRMIQGLNRVYVGSGLVSMQYGSRTIALSASGQRMDGLPTTPSSLANAAPVGTIWSDTSGQLFRVVTG
ncbi:hypothetical protein [Microbacterium sp. YJN-G]|uniref:hypothetical protein n=1 Tax=Microbacterium sp. YJN-G TaxID=2763257 RepID=UPI001878A6A0|nr:hypothetical protein [Microbacterium sp. YJN-G]